MLATHLDAEKRYEAYREEVMKYVTKALPYSDSKEIILTGINTGLYNNPGYGLKFPNDKSTLTGKMTTGYSKNDTLSGLNSQYGIKTN